MLERPPVGRRLGGLVSSLLALTLASPPPAHAQAAPAGEGPDNLVHPAGTATAPLGRLGRVERRGRGAVHLLLVPGASFGWSVWEGFMRRNAERYTMWAVTPPGYDGTRPPPMPEGYPLDRRPWSDALVGALAELIREEEIDRPVVVGHHILGDYYAMRLGLEHPDLVSGVVVIGGLPTRPQRTRVDSATVRPANAEEKLAATREQLLPMMRHRTREEWVEGSMAPSLLSADPERGEALFQRQVANPIPTQLRYFMEWSSSNLTDRLGGLHAPMLVIAPRRWATLDEALRASPALAGRFGSLEEARSALVRRFGSAEDALDALTNVASWNDLPDPPEAFELRTVRGSGVFVMQDRPEETDRILADWIRRRAPRPPG